MNRILSKSLLCLCILCAQAGFFSSTFAFEKDFSIPYPSTSVYLEKGIVAGVAIGLSKAEGEDYKDYSDITLFQWQGEMSYYYTKFISAGLKGKIIAGNPKDSSKLVENRFQSHLRGHKSWKRLAVFAGGTLGFQNSDYTSNQIKYDSTDEDKPIFTNDREEPLFLIIGVETGAGLKVSRLWGLTLAGLVENTINSEVVVKVMPGITFDIRAFLPKHHTRTKSVYFYLESQFNWLDDWSTPKKDDEFATVLGVSLGF